MEKTNETVQTTSRSVLGATAAAVSTGAVASPPLAQSRTEIRKGERNPSASNPGPINQAIATQATQSETPPVSDAGDMIPIWYSFDLAHRRIQDGGWTRQVTQRELPSSRDLAGVNMRLTAGSYRELHWHVANEWAYMLYGNARVTVLNPDGTIFIGDVSEGDLWYFPAGYPHSIQGLGPDGCEFLLVFDQAMFSEYQTFLVSDWLAHTPAEIVAHNLNIPPSAVSKLPTDELYIFPGPVPGSLEDDKKAVGGEAVMSKISYTFRMSTVAPVASSKGGDVRVVDSSIFPASKAIAAALVHVKPGGIRELHWHPNASEWQYWIKGSGRMTVFGSGGSARTMNFNPNDVGYVPAVAGHFIENTGNGDLVMLGMFKSPQYVDISLNQWLHRLPIQITKDHLKISEDEIRMIPDRDNLVVR